MEVYVFGDQTGDCQAFFTKVFTRKDDVLLQSFLEKASDAIRAEQRSRTPSLSAVPNFSTIQELVDRYYQGKTRDPAIESALICISQFAHFIGAFEERTPSYIPSNQDIKLVGLCTGLIAATAISSADSLTGLIPLAVESVRIAFRTGAFVGKVAQQVECSSPSESWSTIMAADEEIVQLALEEFHTAEKISMMNCMWISAASTTSVTISGPPATRNRLFEHSEVFQAHKKATVPIFAPYHSPHLYSAADIRKILRPQTERIFGDAIPRFPICSSVDGTPLPGGNAVTVLEEVLKEILLKPLKWDKVLKYCISDTSQAVKVFAVGPTNLTGSVISALKAASIRVTLEDQSTWTAIPPAGSKQSKREADIAIVGFSGRFPDAADHELFWQLLEKGLDVHRPVPPDRFPVDSHTDHTSKRKNTSHTPYGNFIENPGLFDARFFNMSPREATQTDPMQRLMMTTGYEAMEMAGIVPGRTPSTKHDRIGTFYGQTSDDWREVNAAQEIDTYFISGGVRAFGPGRINYFFKFSGPSFSIDTACSSSFAAINVAITSLRAGECDTAFTGGTNVLTNSDIFSGLSRGHFLSRTGSCKTWDDSADGYCRGDGVCTVIMKRVEDAVADKDPILGVIRGIGTNHSAQAVSITHPCAENQSYLFDKVLKECNVDCNEVSYVEMHGTGTQAGDGIEMESVSSVFAPRHKRRRPDQPLYIGALKSNIGHGEAVSGVSALIKVLLMLQKDKIPPHVGIKKSINKNFAPDLKERGLNIAFQTTPFPRPESGKRIVFINNFSAAGGNTALLMEDGPRPKSTPTQDNRSTQIITVSAKSLASFRKSLLEMERYTATKKGIDLADLAYTTTARRVHYTYRAAFPVQTIIELSTMLKTIQNQAHNPVPLSSPPLAFAFTGQGSQYTAMGKKLFETSASFREDIEEFNAIAFRQGLPSILPLITGAIEVQNLPPSVVQLGMCCVQMALTRLWAAWGVTPSFVIGHSLGEYAALQAAGVLSIADTIYLVGQRAMLLEQKCTAGTHAMLAVRSPLASMQDVVSTSQGKLEIACVNGPSDTVLSGAIHDIDIVAQNLADLGLRSTKLKLPFAFHSSQVDVILGDFEKLASSITYSAPKVPVLSPLLNQVVDVPGVFNHVYLSRHCRNTVNFFGALSTGMSSGIISDTSLWLDIGTHPLCTSMIKSCLSTTALITMRRDEDPWKSISGSVAALYLAGKSLNWESYHKENDGLSCLNDVPSYAFDEKTYWLQYQGDWLLHKGDYPNNVALKTDAKPEAREAQKARKFLSTSVQSIVSEDIGDGTATVVAESDFADPKLWPVVKGHLVNGSGLCPSSLYADIALTLATHTYQLLRPGEKVDCNIGAMENPAPCLLNNLDVPESQIIQMTCKVDLKTKKADFVLSTNDSKKDIVHAKCNIYFEDAKVWKEEWARTAYLIRARIDMLKAKMEDGEADKVSRAMAYKLFTALVDYSDKYQGMQSVIFDGPEFEATSNIKFRSGPEDGTFMYSPYFIDGSAHLSGFTVNATVNAQEECYISHGWSSLRISEPFHHTKSYQAYVKMQPVTGSKMRAGDVWIFDDNKEVVAVVGGLRFQCIPRKLMNIMLPKPRSTTFIGPANPVKTSSSSMSQANASRIKASPHHIDLPAPKVVAKRSGHRLKKSPLPTPSATDYLMAKAFDIIATEIAVDQSELANDIHWLDLGVDSLMSLAIAGKFREELELEIESNIFTDHSSVGALKKYLTSLSRPPLPSPASESSSVISVFDDSSESGDNTIESGITTPEIEDFPPRPCSDKDITSVEGAILSPTTGSPDMIGIMRQVISEEMDMELEEITETTDLSNLGMDSLMALTVLGRLREDHGIHLDPCILAENPSLGHLRKAVGSKAPNESPSSASNDKFNSTVSAPAVEHDDSISSLPPATSVLLQGNPKTATRNMFLFPDGSGSATSYVSIPTIDSKKLAVYGLNCPFMKDPTNYTCGIEGVSKLYLNEVIRRQPVGPYILGGWSAGGVVAYEVTRQLADLEKTNPGKNWYVEKLILIDAPCPVRLEPLPARLHHFFDQIGLLGSGTGKSPAWLLPHFEYSIRALTAYQPELKSIRNFKAPPTLMIWATDGVCGKPSDPRPPPQADDPRSMKWLLENRTDFGPNGWDQLLGEESCKMVKVVGNHFTMMKAPVANDVGRLIHEFLAR